MRTTWEAAGRPRSELATSCWKEHGWLVQTAHEEEGSRVTRCGHMGCSRRWEPPPRFCLECGCRACANPTNVLFAAFSRPLSRCFSLLDRAPGLGLWCAEETSRAQWTICLPSLHLQTRRREEARKGRCACGPHKHPQALLLPGHHRASVREKGPTPLRFWLSTRLLDMKQNATDRFRRDPIGGCHGTERFVLLHHTMHHG